MVENTNIEPQIAPAFLNNEIYFNGERIYKLENPHIKLTITGKNNVIYLNDIIVENHQRGGGMTIVFKTSNGRMKIGKNNRFRFGATLKIDAIGIMGKVGPITDFEIGDENEFNGSVTIRTTTSPDAKIKIGNKNLFAGGTKIWGASHHIIYDKKSKKILNKEKGIEIENCNWFGAECTILNKAKIGSNNVIGMYSMINKEFKNNLLIAGTPAKICRKNIAWHEYNDDSYLKTDDPLEKIK